MKSHTIQGRKFQRIEVEPNGQSAKITVFDRHGHRTINVFSECLAELGRLLLSIADAAPPPADPPPDAGG